MPYMKDLLRFGRAAAPYIPQAVDLINQRRGSSHAQQELLTGTNQAASTINAGSQRAQDIYRGVYEDSKRTLQPYQDFGTESLTRMRDLVNGGDFRSEE